MSSESVYTKRMAEARRLLGAGQPQEAIPCLQHLVSAHDKDAEVQALLGIAVAMTGDAATGTRHLGEAIRLAPRQATYHFNLGCVREQAGDARGAAAAYQRALQIQPGYERAKEGYRRTSGSAAGWGSYGTASPAPGRGIAVAGALAGFGNDPLLVFPSPARAARTAPSSFGVGAPAGPSTYGSYGSALPSGPQTIRDAPQIVRSIRWLYGLAIFVGLCLLLMAVGVASSGRPFAVPVGSIFLFALCELALSSWLMWAVPQGNPAAYYVQMGLSALGLFGVPIGTILHGWILYAWTRPETKAWFGVS